MTETARWRKNAYIAEDKAGSYHGGGIRSIYVVQFDCIDIN